MSSFKLQARVGVSSTKWEEVHLQLGDSIYLMGIGGTAMANLAVYLKSQGFKVCGSDTNLYEPMSSLLSKNNIPVFEYGSQDLSSDIKIVIVGNVIRKDNPELQQVHNLQLAYTSFAEFLEHTCLKDKTKIVVAGTHGKSTTTALMVGAAQAVKQDPSFFVGALISSFKSSFQVRPSEYFIIEGDEYDTAFFAKHPKFYHYHAQALILTSLEFDHADIYKDIKELELVFQTLVSRMSKSSYLLACSDNIYLPKIKESYQGSFFTYGSQKEDHYQICNRKTYNSDSDSNRKTRNNETHNNNRKTHNSNRKTQQAGQSFEVVFQNQTIATCEMTLLGRHNAFNALSVIALSHLLKWDLKPILSFLKSFQGVERRLQYIGEFQEVCLYEDFAHHPTAVKSTVEALKEQFPKRRLIAIFEPRSFTSRLNIFQTQYISALQKADVVIISKAFNTSSIDKDQRFSSEKLAQELKQKGCEAFYAVDTEEIQKQCLSVLKKRDVILIMSNGSFSGLLSKLQKALKVRCE